MEQLIRIRPRRGQNYISQNHSVLITGDDGQIREDREEGLVVYQTRTLSRYRYFIDGKQPRPAALSAVQENSWLGYYIAPAPGESSDTQRTIELRVSRFIGNGLHEELDLTNYTQKTVKLTLGIEVEADFVDQSEMGKGKDTAQGSITRAWQQKDDQWELYFDFHAEHAYDHQGERGVARVHRSIALQVEHSDSPASYQDSRISFQIELKPQAGWHACLNAIPGVEERMLGRSIAAMGSLAAAGNSITSGEKFLTEDAARFRSIGSGTLAASVMQTITRASRDLASLPLHDRTTDGGLVLAAGLPKYVALFGRDCLSASWQASLLSTGMLRGALPVLASLQGTADNPWRDEQPGRIIHQASDELLSDLNYDPFSRYYGTLTASSVYPFALAALWQWTGDTDLVRKYLDTALKAIRWRDTLGDPDGDGFGEYQTRSTGGLKNQGWKDSGEAIVHADGSQVEVPIAPCEEQGFLYIAKIRMAEMLWWIGDRDLAEVVSSSRRVEEEVQRRVLDGEGGLLRNGSRWSKAPDPLHRIERGTSARDRDRGRLAGAPHGRPAHGGRSIQRLGRSHSFQRTSGVQSVQLSARQRLASGTRFIQYGNASLRLPSLCGTPGAGAIRAGVVAGGPAPSRTNRRPAARRITSFSSHVSRRKLASSLVGRIRLLSHLRLLGIFPYAPLKTLIVDPHLPEWLPEITIENVHVGAAVVAIRFFRSNDGSSDYRVLDLKGDLHVIRQPSPWSLTATFRERFVDALTSLTPGR